MSLKYTGGGFGGSLPGVPARDIGDAEIALLGLNEQALIVSGLYVRVENKLQRRHYSDKSRTPEAKEREVKDGNEGTS